MSQTFRPCQVAQFAGCLGLGVYGNFPVFANCVDTTTLAHSLGSATFADEMLLLPMPST